MNHRLQGLLARLMPFDPHAEAAGRWVGDCRQALCEQKGALLCRQARLAHISLELPAVIRKHMLILERLGLEEREPLAASPAGIILVGTDLVLGDRVLCAHAEVEEAIAADLHVDNARLKGLIPHIHAFVASSPELWDGLLIPLPH